MEKRTSVTKYTGCWEHTGTKWCMWTHCSSARFRTVTQICTLLPSDEALFKSTFRQKLFDRARQRWKEKIPISATNPHPCVKEAKSWSSKAYILRNEASFTSRLSHLLSNNVVRSGPRAARGPERRARCLQWPAATTTRRKRLHSGQPQPYLWGHNSEHHIPSVQTYNSFQPCPFPQLSS